jgi:demethylmacrocin O-methyltransferase
VKRVLEIGVLNGASLAMWRDYWPQAEVWGFDKERRETDIQVMYGDQSKPEDLAFATRLGPFDLVIDDGSHVPADQVLGALTLVPHLAPGGLYIIEDVNSPFILDGIPWPNQLVFCHVPGSDKTGRCVVIPCPS